MKTWTTFLLTTWLGLLTGTAWAQQWTVGPKIRVPLSNYSSATTLVADQTTLTLNGYGGTLEQWAAFARYDRDRFFAQGELLTGKVTQGGYSTIDGNSYGVTFESRMLGINGLAGFKLLPWLRVYGGPGYRHYDWSKNRFGNFGQTADRYEQRLTESGLFDEQVRLFTNEAKRYRLLQATNNAYRRHVLVGQLGLGIDIGGLTIDLSHERSITPLLRDVPTATQTFSIRQNYSSYVLSFGYRLLPLKAHLLAPRKRNPAYQRVIRDIPFYRNEFHLAVGLLGEDIGSAFLYENRYTRYFKRRFGLTGGLNVMRMYEDVETGFLPNHYTRVQFITGLRALPLYSRRHTIGLSAGPTLTYERGLTAMSGGTRTLRGYTYQYVTWRADSRLDKLTLNWQATLDYHFAATDRLIVGPWLRLNGLDYATFGIQTGYRF